MTPTGFGYALDLEEGCRKVKLEVRLACLAWKVKYAYTCSIILRYNWRMVLYRCFETQSWETSVPLISYIF